MYNIILICTKHKESGNCNAIELTDIIEQINPEIIFEELSYANFDECYKQKNLITLESNAIKRYLQNHEVNQIPVDTYPLPQYYYEQLARMYERLCTSNRINESRALKNLLDQQFELEYQYGFQYLNSDQNDMVFDQISFLTEKILEILNDDVLRRIRKLEKEMIEKREYEILKNIYEFSSNNEFNRAVAFIGSGHRKSMMALIKIFEKQEDIKLNWKIYNT